MRSVSSQGRWDEWHVLQVTSCPQEVPREDRGSAALGGKHTSLTCPHPSRRFFSYFSHFFSLRINKPGVDYVVISCIILFISLSLTFHSQQPTLNNDLPLPHAGPSARTESLGGPGDVCAVSSLIAGEETRWELRGLAPSHSRSPRSVASRGLCSGTYAPGRGRARRSGHT